MQQNLNEPNHAPRDGSTFAPIYRARIVDRITSAAKYRITLIVAPAGYGKSTALRQYLSKTTGTIIRYDLRPDNAELLGFLRGFSAACADVAPDLRGSVGTAYNSARSSKKVAHDLATWFNMHLARFTGTIAIDDLHIAERDRQVSEFIAALVDLTRDRVRWIIASRTDLDLPLGSWLAYADMDVAIDETDLAFTLDESRTASAALGGARDDELAQLHSLTSGWPTALSFALRSSTRSDDLRNVRAATKDMVYRYLAEQIYNALDDSDRDLLLTAAIPADIDPSILEAAGQEHARAKIESLRRRVAFITTTGENATVHYRMHDLFRDFLVHRLTLEDPGDVKTRQCALARAFEDRANMPAALSMYAQARSIPDLMRIIDIHGLILFGQCHLDALMAAINVLRDNGHADHPTSLAIRGVMFAEQGSVSEAEAHLRRAIELTDDPIARATFQLHLTRLIINISAKIGGSTHQFQNPVDILESIEASEQTTNEQRAEAGAMLAVVFSRDQQHYEKARSAVDRALARAANVSDQVVLAKVYQRLALASFELVSSSSTDYRRTKVNATRSLELYQRAGALAEANGMISLSGLCYSGIGNVYSIYITLPKEQLTNALRSYELGLKSGDRGNQQTASMQILLAASRMGDDNLIDHYMAVLATLDYNRAHCKHYTAGIRAIVNAWQGRFEEAFQEVSEIWPETPPIHNMIEGAAECALYAAAAGRTAESAEIVTLNLQRAKENFENGVISHTLRACAEIFCALAEGLSGRNASARRILSKVDVKNAEYPQVALFANLVDAGLRALRTLDAPTPDFAEYELALRKVSFGGYARILTAAIRKVLAERKGHLELIRGALPNHPDDQNDGPLLTGAEIDVLKQLATGHTPQEIAEDLGRSVHTVRTHTQNAIAKLGCHSRLEALAVARRLNIIP